MAELVIMKNKQAVTSSLDVAVNFDKRHDHILRDLDELREGVTQNWGDLFWEDTYIHPQNKQPYRMIFMNRDGFSLLAMGFTGKKALEFKLKYIKAFNEMEDQIIKGTQYQVPTDPMSALKLMFQATEETKEDIQEVKKRVVNLEENGSLNPGEYNYVSKRVSQRIFQIGRDRSYNMNKKQKAELFKALNSEIAFITGVKTRAQLKNKHFDMVIDFIEDWEPSKATTVVVKQLELEVI